MVKEIDVKLEAFPGLMKKEYHYESPKMHFMQNPKMIQTAPPMMLSPPQQDILQATPKPKKKAPVMSVEAKPKESKKARKLL